MPAASVDQILEALDPEQREVVTAVRGPVFKPLLNRFIAFVGVHIGMAMPV